MAGTLIHFVLVLAVAGYGVYLFAKVVYHRYLYMKLGKPANFAKDTKARLREFAVQVFGQTKLLKDKKSGMMHIIIFYGFIILQFGALDLILKGLIGRGLPIPGYEAFGFSQEVTAALIVLAMAYATYRRYVEKLKRLKRGWKPSIVVFFITFLMLFVILSLGFERVREQLPSSGWAPISSLFAAGFHGISYQAATVGFYVSWWLHLVILLTFLVYVPQSKHFHIITAPINLWLRRTEPVGRLTKLDLEDENAEEFGVGKVEDFTQKQMLDFYSCVECGRCTNVCPASNTGKILSPMHLITKLRDHLTEKGAVITSKPPWVPALAGSAASFHTMKFEPEKLVPLDGDLMTDIEPTLKAQKESWHLNGKTVNGVNLIGDVMTEDEIWSCTTCRNCEDQCPVGNEHVDKIIDLRRYLVLTQGSMPCMENIETFQKYGVKKIVTACPHTYNTLKNEYTDFGLEAEIWHHTELLDSLIREGRLQQQHEVRERITYHDSCYLGRYNEVYDQPRNVLRAIPGVELVEQERSRENGICCGAGGGMMWMEETAGKRVNLARTEQLLTVNPTMISSACPYCLTMVEDGTKLKEVEETVKARDIAEILELSVFGSHIKEEASV